MIFDNTLSLRWLRLPNKRRAWPQASTSQLLDDCSTHHQGSANLYHSTSTSSVSHHIASHVILYINWSSSLFSSMLTTAALNCSIPYRCYTHQCCRKMWPHHVSSMKWPPYCEHWQTNPVQVLSIVISNASTILHHCLCINTSQMNHAWSDSDRPRLKMSIPHLRICTDSWASVSRRCTCFLFLLLLTGTSALFRPLVPRTVVRGVKSHWLRS